MRLIVALLRRIRDAWRAWMRKPSAEEVESWPDRGQR